MADICFTAAYSQTSWVTEIPVHGIGQCLARDRHASVWWINLHARSCQAHSGVSREHLWQRSRLSRPASYSHQGCNGVNADSTGTTTVNSNVDAKEWISYAKDKSWHVCVLDVFVVMYVYALGGIINQQCVRAENGPRVPSFAPGPNGLLVSPFPAGRIRCKKSTQARQKEKLREETKAQKRVLLS